MSPEGRPPGPVLGLDLGDARIGTAISDPERRIAVPLGTILVGQPPGELLAIAGIVKERGITLVVVGLPRSMSGEAGPRAHKAEGFADALRAGLSISVELHDERLSTVEAERLLRATGASAGRRRAAVDRTAATVILQAWLDARGRGT
jgi:putative pre-16S rRNA nuclease